MLKWRGRQLMDKLTRAQKSGVNTTMAAAVLKAKFNHGPGAHAQERFETHTGSLERSIQVVDKAARVSGGVRGLWGSTDIVYALRIELGFQGKDSKGRIYDQPAFPFCAQPLMLSIRSWPVESRWRYERYIRRHQVLADFPKCGI